MNEFAHIYMYCLFNILYKIYTNHKTRIRLKTYDRWNFINILNANTTKVYRLVREIAKSDYWHRHVCSNVRPPARSPARPLARSPAGPLARMEQLSSHWTDFHEILYLRIFRKSVEKMRVSMQSDKNKGYFT